MSEQSGNSTSGYEVAEDGTAADEAVSMEAPEAAEQPAYDQSQYDQSQPVTYGEQSSYATQPSASYPGATPVVPTGSPAATGYGSQASYPQPSYGTQGYQANQQAYPAPQPGYGPMQPQLVMPEHPQAQTVLVLAIVGLFLPILSFVAWYMGSQAKKEIDHGAPYRWDGGIKIGYILGLIVSILAIVFTVFMILYFVTIFIIGAGLIFSAGIS